jgi:polysaccharide export outer membrane protein
MRRSLRVIPPLAALAATALVAQDPPLVSGAGSSYSLRSGDIVRIDVWGQTAYSGQFQVDERGILLYPVVGEIDTKDLTVADLRDRVRAGLETVFNAPFVTVTPLFRMAVLGEVSRPGLYTVDPTLSVIDVVALAGGPTRNGDLNKIQVVREGEQLEVSFRRDVMQGRSLQEIGVRSGDQILVARRAFTRDDLALLLQGVSITLSLAILIRSFQN